ncbi:catalase family protein [Methylocapsa polymorpha]|uniref:Catalase family protein n=1 Tax=Methylocapsa polymorpha TaxID=3080828 RepID=A0ABZ0HV08_9HYPH|nr:catalase family protein [Methylocapsa sp. RX1]
MLLKAFSDALTFSLHVERRFEPWFRPAFDRVLRDPLAKFIQVLINLQRTDEGLELAEEKPLPDEEKYLQAIIDEMAQQMRNHFKPGRYERGGNTKTHGIVRATLTIRDDLPSHLRHGVFAEPRSYPCWVRYSGPGPTVPADIDDVGFGSMTIKIIGVPGPKLLPDETTTQDLLCVCTPTFVTPDTRANADLQYWSLREMPIYYFLNPKSPHLLDFFMQSLWNETQYNPLGQYYYSCVPYLLGEGQAMQYSFYPRTEVPREIPGLPFHAPPNYLRDNMVKTLAEKDVEFDIRVQVQTDPFRMPIENAAVLWPEKLSPRIPVARLHIPRQKFDSPAQFAFVDNLVYNPWHCLPEHRPLGNQSRARLRLYSELSKFRLTMNHKQHIEPTGYEVFE